MKALLLFLIICCGLTSSSFAQQKKKPSDLLLTAINTAIKAPDRPVEPKVRENLFAFNSEVAAELAEKLEFDEFEELDQYLDKQLEENVYRTNGYLIYPSLVQSLSSRSPYLKEWREATNSVHSQLAWAAKQIDIGWKARGNGFANQVGAKDALTFHEYNAEARKICDELEKNAIDNPVRLKILARSALALGLREGELEKLVELSTQSKTPDADLAANLIHYLKPRWHGSPEEIASFVEIHLPKWPDTPSKFDALWDTIEEAETWGDTSPLKNLRYQSAVERMLGKLDRTWPEDIFIVRTITRTSNSQQCYEFTNRLAEKALKKFPNHIGLLIDHGRALAETGEGEKGISHLKRACEIRPDLGNAYFELAKAYATGKKWKLAYEAAQDALDADHRIFHWQALECLRVQWQTAFWFDKDYELSLKLMERSVKMDPRAFGPRFRLGMSLTKAGRKEDAKKEFKKLNIKKESDLKWLDENLEGWNE